MSAEAKHPGYFSAVLNNKCPRCREGEIYVEKNPYKLKSIVKMHQHCTTCGQPTEIEVGFYYGTGYVSYALAVGVCVASFIIWYLTVGFSLKDSRFFMWLGVNAVLLLVLQPYLMRLSRTLWLSWFVSYDPNWRIHPLDTLALKDRIINEEMGNW
jgi:uncharacterized protein (DUF983 family)